MEEFPRLQSRKSAFFRRRWQTLTEDDKDGRSSFHALRSVLHDLAGIKIFTVFISTNDIPHDIALPGSKNSSARANSKSLAEPHAPYVAFPYDVSPDDAPIVTEDDIKLVRVADLEYACKFGRPLSVPSLIRKCAAKYNGDPMI